MAQRTIVAQEYAKLAQVKTAIVEMPRYFQTNATSQELNSEPWTDFVDHMRTLVHIPIPQTKLELLVVKKDIQWSCEDVSIFVGGAKRIDLLDDLSTKEGAGFFGLQFDIARRLYQLAERPVQITLGFNPDDLSPGHHSLLRLHTHLRRIGHPLDYLHIKPLDLKTATNYEKLGLIEPFTAIYLDRIRHFLQHCTYWQVDKAPSQGYGCVRFSVKTSSHEDFFIGLKQVFTDLRQEFLAFETTYAQPPSIDGHRKLHNALDRKSNIERYLAQAKIAYSPTSARLLRLFVHQIGIDDKTQQIQLQDGNDVYAITRGYAGAFNFLPSADGNEITIEFFPRIITKSGPSKTMLGPNAPLSSFVKIADLATEAERAVSADFQDQITHALHAALPGEQIFPVFDPLSSELKYYKARSLVHRQGDWHKGVQANILRLNPAGETEILMQLRSSRVDIGKAKYDQSLATQLLLDDALSTDHCLARGLLSELGVYGSQRFHKLDFEARIIKQYDDEPEVINQELLSLYLVQLPYASSVDITATGKIDQIFWLRWSEFLEFFDAHQPDFTKTGQFYFATPEMRAYIDAATMAFMKHEPAPPRIEGIVVYKNTIQDEYRVVQSKILNRALRELSIPFTLGR